MTAFFRQPHFVRAAALAAATLWACAAHAQTTTVLLPETIVSASRVPVDRHKVGSSVTVLTQQDMRTGGGPFLSDSLRDVPSAHVSRTGTYGGFTEIRLRGSESNHVLVMMDGVRLNDPALGNVFDFGRLYSYGLRRVEVLRGPQSGLYGPDALAGVINIETPRGRPGLRVETFSEAGSFNTWAGGGRISGGVKGLTFSFFGARAVTSGTNISRPTALPFANEDDESGNTTIHGKIVATPASWLEITLAGRFGKNRLQFDGDNNFDGLSNDADQVTRFETGSWIARARIKLLDNRWITELSISGLSTDTETLINGAFNTSFEGRRIRYAAQTSYAFDTRSLARAEHKVILGGEFEKLDFRQFGVFVPFVGSPNQDRNRSRTGVVLEYRLGLLDALYFSAALRHDQNDSFPNTFTWRVTGAWRIRRWGTRLHSSAGRGVKNPTFLEQFGFFPNSFVGNPNLRPESSIGWDVGVEQSLFKGRLIADLTFFQSWLRDEINGFFGLGGGRFTARNVPGISTRTGVEFTLVARPFRGLTVKGQYAYLVAQQDGTQEVRRARHSGSVSATYRFLGNRASISGAVRFNGPMRDTNFGPFPAVPVTLGGYVLVNVAASYRINKYVEVFARVENALNQRYEEVFSFQGPRIGVFGGIRIKLDLL